MLACKDWRNTYCYLFWLHAQAYTDRVNDSESKVIITADGGFRRGKLVELKKIVDMAVSSVPSIEHVIVLKRAQIMSSWVERFMVT